MNKRASISIEGKSSCALSSIKCGIPGAWYPFVRLVADPDKELAVVCLPFKCRVSR